MVPEHPALTALLPDEPVTGTTPPRLGDGCALDSGVVDSDGNDHAWDEGALRTVLRPSSDEASDDADDDDAGRAPRRLADWSSRLPGRERLGYFERRHVLVVVAILTVAVLVGGWFLLRARDHPADSPVEIPAALGTTGPSDTEAPSVGASVPTASATGTPPAPTTIVVHVLGAVRRPGVVKLPEGSRVADAISAAGGLADRAVTGRLNLAQVLFDGQQVYLSARADAPSEVTGPGPASGGGDGSPGSGGTSTQKVNLNTASATELETLPGVGPATAQAIVAWREQHGRFTSVNDLQQVDGIGPKTFAKLAPLVTV